MSRLLCLLLLVCVGCAPIVPAMTPPQIEHTPGAFVRVDAVSAVYDAGVFRVAYPYGWRVVKSSVAGALMQVVFVAPDDRIMITVSEGDMPLPDTEANEIILHERIDMLTVLGRAPESETDYLEAVFASVVDSLQRVR